MDTVQPTTLPVESWSDGVAYERVEGGMRATYEGSLVADLDLEFYVEAVTVMQSAQRGLAEVQPIQIHLDGRVHTQGGPLTVAELQQLSDDLLRALAKIAPRSTDLAPTTPPTPTQSARPVRDGA